MATPTERELLQDTIREAHGMLKDFRKEVRRAERVRDDLTNLVEREAEKQVDKHVLAHIKAASQEIQREMQIAVDKGVDKVNSIFDELATIIIHGDKNKRKESLLDLMEKAVRKGA